MNVYRTIVADPPWHYDEFVTLWPENQSRGGEAAVKGLPYASLSVAAIAALPVGALAARDCNLFLWTTNRYLRDAFDVLAAWGFPYRQTLVWEKTNPSPWAGSVAPNAEFILVGTRGEARRSGRLAGPVIRTSRPSSGHRTKSHSEKPEVFLDLVESVSAGPYLELFARRNRLGWDTWGNESLGHVEIGGVPHER